MPPVLASQIKQQIQLIQISFWTSFFLLFLIILGPLQNPVGAKTGPAIDNFHQHGDQNIGEHSLLTLSKNSETCRNVVWMFSCQITASERELLKGSSPGGEQQCAPLPPCRHDAPIAAHPCGSNLRCFYLSDFFTFQF